MPEVGPFEILVVAVVALVVFGPEKLPEIARTIGRTLADFRRVVDEAKGEFQSGFDFDDDEPSHPMDEVLYGGAERADPRDRYGEATTLTEIPDRPASSLEGAASTQSDTPSVTGTPTSLQPPREEPHEV
jgi:Tat protein translocase TatB subunit